MGDHSVDEVTVGDMSDHAKEGCVERDKIELAGAWPEFQAIPFHEAGAGSHRPLVCGAHEE